VSDETQEGRPDEHEAGPLEREELTLPDGRRLLLYSRREPPPAGAQEREE
jgi:hypothetical protein